MVVAVMTKSKNKVSNTNLSHTITAKNSQNRKKKTTNIGPATALIVIALVGIRLFQATPSEAANKNISLHEFMPKKQNTLLASSVEVDPSASQSTVKTVTLLAPAVRNVWSIVTSQLGQFFSILLQKVAWLFSLLWKFLQALRAIISSKGITKTS